MAINQNRYVSEFADKLKLKKNFADSNPIDNGSGKLAIVSKVDNKRGMAFIESDSKIQTIATMLWRYGIISFYYLRSIGQ